MQIVLNFHNYTPSTSTYRHGLGVEWHPKCEATPSIKAYLQEVVSDAILYQHINNMTKYTIFKHEIEEKNKNQSGSNLQLYPWMFPERAILCFPCSRSPHRKLLRHVTMRLIYSGMSPNMKRLAHRSPMWCRM